MALPYGQILTEKRHRRSDLRMIERAVRNGWVPADRRAEIVRQVAAVLADDPTPRERVAVARVTNAMRAGEENTPSGVEWPGRTTDRERARLLTSASTATGA